MKILNSSFSKSVMLAFLALSFSSIYLEAQEEDARHDPIITSISPNSGSIQGGTMVTITGANFHPENYRVYFGEEPAWSITLISLTEIVAVTRRGVAGIVDVTYVADYEDEKRSSQTTPDSKFEYVDMESEL